MALIRGEQITGSVASASFALTSSYAISALSGSYAFTASYAFDAVSSSYALSSSYAVSASRAISASYAETSSFATQFHISTGLTASGLIYPAADNGEFSFVQTDGNGNLSLQYVNTLYEVVYNGEATQLVKGTPVYISGSQGANTKAYRADAGNPLKMPVAYVVADNINPSNTGRAIALGLITGVDTTGYPAGTEIYVAVGGGWTSVRPTGSAIVQVLGYVTKEGNGGQGVVLNPGPANLPNLNSGSVWVGNGSSIPTSISTASLTVLSSSYAQSASYAVTASYLLGYISPFPFTGSAQITGSLSVTGSTSFSGSVGTTVFSSNADTLVMTGSFLLTGSMSVDGLIVGTASYANQALSSSFATFAISASYIDGGFY